ncbi:hypothetical protein D3C84_541100 [compost metagenome]
MPVVMQAALDIEILPLKPQRLLKLLAPTERQPRNFSVGVVLRRPDNFTAVIGQFLRRTQVIELVVKRASLARAFAVEHGQWAEGARFVNIAAVVLAAAFSDEVVALPEELGGFAVDGFSDAAAKSVVAVTRATSVRGRDADQAMLAVVGIFGDEFLPSAATFADQVAEGVVVVMPVALHEQAIAFYGSHTGAVLHQQVAGRVVGEAFRWVVAGVAHAGQAVEGVVVITALAVAAVGDGRQVAVDRVGVVAQVQRPGVLIDRVCLQAALFVVVVAAGELALLALLFAAKRELVGGERRAVEVDGGQRATLGVVVIEFAAVRQAHAVELATGVVAVAQGAPALVLGDQTVLSVVLEFQWMIVTVVDADQSAEAVIAIFDLDAIGQRFDQQPPCRISLISGNPLRAVVAELGFFQQVSIEVVGVRRALAIESGFLSDQSARCVVQAILFAGFVFDFREQQLRVVVAIAELRAVGVDPAADQMQTIDVFVAGNEAKLVAFGGDFSVGVVAKGARGPRRKCRLNQSPNGVPPVVSERSVFILIGNPSTQRVVGKPPQPTVRQSFFNQLP